jgi:hypothetical protein
MVNWLTDKRHQRHHRESFLLVSAENRGPVEDGSAPRRLRRLRRPASLLCRPGQPFRVRQLRTRTGTNEAFGRHSSG